VEIVRRGTVRNGVVEVDGEPLPEGANVVVDLEPPLSCELDENGDVIMTPELEAELAAAEAEAEQGLGIPYEEVFARLRIEREEHERRVREYRSTSRKT
jgi:hypothetical protein